MNSKQATPAEPNADFSAVPDASGRFGEFGRRFVPETLMQALEELTAEYEQAKKDESFQVELSDLLVFRVANQQPIAKKAVSFQRSAVSFSILLSNVPVSAGIASHNSD